MRTHGKFGTYNSGCRCEPCLVAGREYHRQFRAKRVALAQQWVGPNGRPFLPGVVHDGITVTGYTGGCRCDRCVAAHAAWQGLRRRRRSAAAHAIPGGGGRHPQGRTPNTVGLPAAPEPHTPAPLGRGSGAVTRRRNPALAGPAPGS